MKLQKGICLFSVLVVLGSACLTIYQTTISPHGNLQNQIWPTDIGDMPLTASMISLPMSTPIPTPLPIDQADYQGWWTYTHPAHGFTLLLPEDWVVEETTTGDELMNGYFLHLHPRNPTENQIIHMTFREIGDIVPLGSGVTREGELLPFGFLNVVGQPARRILLNCQTGQVSAIWYFGPDENDVFIQKENMEFQFIFRFTGIHCKGNYSLVGKNQLIGEMIITSLNVP